MKTIKINYYPRWHNEVIYKVDADNVYVEIYSFNSVFDEYEHIANVRIDHNLNPKIQIEYEEEITIFYYLTDLLKQVVIPKLVQLYENREQILNSVHLKYILKENK